MQFQPLTTKDLNGKSVKLPDDFTNELNLLFVAYTEWQQREVDSWVPFSQTLEAEMESFRFYELPVVGKMNIIGRTQLDFWMRKGIPNKETRSRTLTYYVDRDQFREMLGLETADHIATVLVDRAGNLLWKAYGPFSEESGQSLRAKLKDLFV